ncbi:hypothetical protein WI665_12035 [Vibrio cholerae]
MTGGLNERNGAGRCGTETGDGIGEVTALNMPNRVVYWDKRGTDTYGFIGRQYAANTFNADRRGRISRHRRDGWRMYLPAHYRWLMCCGCAA